MAYRFVGFLAKPSISPTPDATRLGVWRTIATPFDGVGVRLPDERGNGDLEPAEILATANRLGIAAADDWIFLFYECWGGTIDFVYGLGSRGGRPFGPVDTSDWSKVEAAYVALMGEFGVGPHDALHFAPFERGFWDE